MGQRISITPNVEYSLKVLDEAVQGMPEGEKKKKAKGAIAYLKKAAKGEKQPKRGRMCPTPKEIWP